ncbi:MAG: NAD-dependent epimerase/dehydratase family protein [Hyphomicrobiales bacterium]|nr:NAD-dependent epimerase/dehydratase family protein [Hyphomicrobiales bacterium]
MRVLITGGLGLIGSGLRAALEAIGATSEAFDLRGSPSEGDFGDIRDLDSLRARVRGFDGIVHLAAVSRVIWCEQDPVDGWATNVDGTKNVLRAAGEVPGRRPWFLYASSREVYGQHGHLPVSEDAPLWPINVYGRSKVAAETMTMEARAVGLVTGIMRLSNVFGSTHDHPNRVVPAFARAAAMGGVMHIEGGENVFDFTWLDDVARGIASFCQALSAGGELPPIHFVTGRGTNLLELADMAQSAGGPGTRIEHHPPRSYDVERFWGDPQRAKEVLGWSAETSVEDGVGRLVKAFMLGQDEGEAAETGTVPS